MIEVNPYFASGERYPSIIGVKADGDEYELAYIRKAEAMDREPVVRCRDCKFAIINSLGDCKYCEKFWDTDGDAQLNLPGDFFCAWGERRPE